MNDKPRSGRPPKLTPEEKDLARQYIKEDPRCLKQVVERLSQKTAKRLSISSLKRLAKKARLRLVRPNQQLAVDTFLGLKKSKLFFRTRVALHFQ